MPYDKMRQRRLELQQKKLQKLERKNLEQTAFNNQLSYFGVVILVMGAFYLLIVLFGIYKKYF
ncbi:hypothetical protein [Acinetobacter dispersus]|uniref:hypothetical protein n=1 Tax=Acinetobacter dispersus TaxID=70348 RepID=UPI0005180E72|nr:hypothetical protein [Acinetobacter dispersus]